LSDLQRGDLLLEETFDEGAQSGPKLIAEPFGDFGWRDGKYLLRLTGDAPSGMAKFVGRGAAVGNMVGEARVYYTGGRLIAWFRLLGEVQRTQNILMVEPDGAWQVQKEWASWDGQWHREKVEAILGHRPHMPVITEGKWVTLEIRIEGEVVEIRAGGQLMMRYTDKVGPGDSATAAGNAIMLGIASNGTGPAILEIDHLRIWALKTK
jgi:hypothetical protein